MAALTDELVQRLLTAADQIGQRRVEELLAEARAEAEAEIKSLLKSAMKASLLRQMVSRLEGDETPAASAAEAPLSPAESQTAAQSGCYLYAILRADHAMPHDEVLAAVRPVAFEDLQAATAQVATDEFKKGAERANDLAWIEQKARHHDAVLKALMAGGPIIPLRLGTVLRDEEAVRQVLARHAEPLRANLAALAGKKEWGVKVLMDAEAVTKATEPREQPATASVGNAAGRAYFARKQREEANRAESNRASHTFAKECHEQLSAAAAGAVLLAVPKPEAGQPQVISNAAYLVANDEAIRFHRAVDHLMNRYESHGLSLQVTGPWPPYNFVRLELSLEGPA